jgi:hypothetical protein
MPRGGKRKGSGRKPKPLAEKIAAGNPGHRPLTKVEFFDDSYNPSQPPDFIDDMRSLRDHPTKKPSEIYREQVEYLLPSGCLYLISREILTEYAIAKYNLLQAQYESKYYPIVGKTDKGSVEISQYQELVMKWSKTVLAIETFIWDIISRNSERVVDNPEHDLMKTMFGGRIRNPVKKKED